MINFTPLTSAFVIFQITALTIYCPKKCTIKILTENEENKNNA
jgi:hypothetical protein